MDICKICEIVQRARTTTGSKADITTVVDSTLAPPVIQQPLQVSALPVYNAMIFFFLRILTIISILINLPYDDIYIHATTKSWVPTL